MIWSLMKKEDAWCKYMGYFNPYIDPFTHHLSNKLPFFDMAAYKRYPNYQFVYDKLWVIKSQGLKGGKLEELKDENLAENISYPIFIKPRWGHLSAASKNCFKIKSAKHLKKYVHYPHMMWSEFVDAKECMTDFFVLNGAIVHQITYVYSDKQNGFTDDWKLVSPASVPPQKIIDWTEKHMRNFTGVVNVQYRSDKIIEVGLRLARGGAYVISTDNKALIDNINSLYLKNSWDTSLSNEMQFKPFYVYKCFTVLPIVYILPQKVMDWIISARCKRPFYEYYFEPAGESGMVFYQFMDDDFENGMKTKQFLENLFAIVQILVMIGLFLAVGSLIFTSGVFRYYFFLIIVLFWLTRFLNPFIANFNLYKAQRQSIFGAGPVQGPNDVKNKVDDQDDYRQ